MRKFIAAAIAAAAVSTIVPSQAAEARTEKGTILAPAVTGPTGLVTRHQRCAYLLTEEATTNGDDSNGIFGWHVAIDPETEGAGDTPFALTGSAGDVQIVFYEGLGQCEGGPTGTPVTVANPGNESGKIPMGTAHAIIVVEGAANVDFELKIG